MWVILNTPECAITVETMWSFKYPEILNAEYNFSFFKPFYVVPDRRANIWVEVSTPSKERVVPHFQNPDCEEFLQSKITI